MVSAIDGASDRGTAKSHRNSVTAPCFFFTSDNIKREGIRWNCVVMMLLLMVEVVVDDSADGGGH